jgi:hypothetical protein
VVVTAARRHADVSRWVGRQTPKPTEARGRSPQAVSRKPGGAGSGQAIDRLVEPRTTRNRVRHDSTTRNQSNCAAKSDAFILLHTTVCQC